VPHVSQKAGTNGMEAPKVTPNVKPAAIMQGFSDL
jgi:hypothetical protein